VATVVSTYRKVIDEVFENPSIQNIDDFYYQELTKVSHRNYTTGFFHGKTDATDQNYGTSSYTRTYDFIGVVLEYDQETQMATIQQRNKISVGDEIEVMIPGKGYFTQQAEVMIDAKGNVIESTPHPKMIYQMKMEEPVAPMDILRKKD
jgi:putative protease